MQGSGVAEARPLVGQSTDHELCNVIRIPREFAWPSRSFLQTPLR
jgi:hypothetical protein